MNSNDFYVSLPSNVCMKTFPKNKQSNYTTLLEEPIILPLNFQVALVEISNFSDFKVQMGRISFKNPFWGEYYQNRARHVEFTLAIENGISLKDFCEKLNYEIQNNCIKTEYLFRQKIAHNTDNETTDAIHLSNELNFLQDKPILNVLKHSNSHFEVIANMQSSFRDILFSSGATFLSNRFIFNNIDILKSKFDLIVLDVSKINETNSNTYYIDKKKMLLSDAYLVNTIPNNDPDKIAILSQIEPESIDPFQTETETRKFGTNFNISTEIWGDIPIVKQLDNNTITIEVKRSEITFEGLISMVLNNNDVEITILNYSEIFSLPSNLQLIKYILVYTDIIEAQYFGDVRASILRTVNIKANKGDNVTFFDNPHYLNVCKTRIDTINIEICDVNGNHIEFKDLFSNIYISLHFKPRN